MITKWKKKHGSLPLRKIHNNYHPEIDLHNSREIDTKQFRSNFPIMYLLDFCYSCAACAMLTSQLTQTADEKMDELWQLDLFLSAEKKSEKNRKLFHPI